MIDVRYCIAHEGPVKSFANSGGFTPKPGSFWNVPFIEKVFMNENFIDFTS